MGNYDVAVLGLGAMGSSAIYQLAKNDVKVIGIDQYSPPHDKGSTHGDTRITRLATGEGPECIPLAKRSQEIWKEEEKETGTKLLYQCGGLQMTVSSRKWVHHNTNDFLVKVSDLAEQFGIEHEVLSFEQIKKRYPEFNLEGTETAYYEPASGYVLAEKCVEVNLELAKKYGAELRLNEKVVSFQQIGTQVEIRTNRGVITAEKLIVSAGPWIKELLPEYKNLFKIYRQVLYWFDLENKAKYDDYHNLPVYMWGFGPTQKYYVYGFPAIDGPDGGVKVASEFYEHDTSPEKRQKEVSQVEIDYMYANYVKDRFPGLSSRCLKAKTCLYTNTPDEKFIIDFHPEHKNIIVASPCSGHGFKHSAAIGEILSQLAQTGHSNINIDAFAFERFK